MADAPTSNDWLQLLMALPPQLQGVAVAAAGGVGAIFLWQRFRKSYLSPQEEPRGEILVGEAATFADLKPIRELVENVSLLTIQMMKNEVQSSSLATRISSSAEDLLEAHREMISKKEDQQTQLMTSLSQLADLLAQHLADQRQEREEREDREREDAAREEGRLAGYQQAMAEKAKPVRRPTRIKKG